MHPRDYGPRPRLQMGNHDPALDHDQPLDAADSHKRSPAKSSPKMREPSIESDDSDEVHLTMKIPGKDPIRDESTSRPPKKAREQAAKEAHEKAQRLSRRLNHHSSQGSMTPSPSRSRSSSSAPSKLTPLDLNNIPLQKLKRRRHFSIEDDTAEDEVDRTEGDQPVSAHWWNAVIKAIRSYWPGSRSLEGSHELQRVNAHDPPLPSGQVTPIHEENADHEMRRPRVYRQGYLSLRLYQQQGVRPAIATIPGGPAAVARANDRMSVAGLGNEASSSRHHSAISPTSSGASSPVPKHEKWYYKNKKTRSFSSVSKLIQSSTSLAQPAITGPREDGSPISPRPTLRSRSTGALDMLFRGSRRRPDDIRIEVHIAETLSRQRYLVKLCHALMKYGAPTHRLEEYMRMSARVLEIHSQFFYLPTCMVIAFDDDATHTSEIKLVRTQQGIDLNRLKYTHDIYKEVLHDKIGVDEAIPRLDEVMKRGPLYGRNLHIIMHGLSSATVAPFAFKARLIDLPFAFMLGIFVGCCELYLVPRSDLYSNVFEVFIAIVTSFASRGLGSVRHGPHICFSALAQSAIVLILPGYTLLCGCLELQSKSVVAGSVRIVNAIISALFLGFGITIGTALYGVVDSRATSAISCENPMEAKWTLFFVPLFTGSLIIISEGRIKQMVVMIVVSFIGYIVNHFTAQSFGNIPVSQAIGALVVGVLANLYSRLRHGLAVAAVLPAVFVQVPSGLAAAGSLITGMANADEITGNGGSSATTDSVTGIVRVKGQDMIFNVGYSMIQIAIGITVGLFFSSLIVYPTGKRRSGLFSF